MLDTPPDRGSDDIRLMHAALALGRRSMGRAAPNPAVGALVVKDGVVIGRGLTAPGGRPHAEPLALAAAGASARGATLYVTLEPCSHHGRTPPCVDAILAAGIGRVVIALRDPDPRVAGRGAALLRGAGLDVVEGVAADEARRDHLGHLRRVICGRPAITVKMAETADGKAASMPGRPRLLITSETANARVQMLRAEHDAILVGRGTALADDPLLTVRLPGMASRRPLRVVLDSALTTPVGSRLVETAAAPVLLLAAAGADDARASVLAARGVAVSRIAADARGLILPDALAELGARGITRVLCEGGPRLASALVVQDLADRFVLFTSSRPSEGSGQDSLTGEARSWIESGTHFALRDEIRLGPDLMRSYERVEAPCSPV